MGPYLLLGGVACRRLWCTRHQWSVGGAGRASAPCCALHVHLGGLSSPLSRMSLVSPEESSVWRGAAAPLQREPPDEPSGEGRAGVFEPRARARALPCP